jgi:tRNA uridine 5-carbamoylmethylation protein Kti12
MNDTPFDDVQDVRSSDYTEGWEDCEQRVIKLLRTELGPYLIWVDDTPYIKGIDLDGFIALIKGEGENK